MLSFIACVPVCSVLWSKRDAYSLSLRFVAVSLSSITHAFSAFLLQFKQLFRLSQKAATSQHTDQTETVKRLEEEISRLSNERAFLLQSKEKDELEKQQALEAASESGLLLALCFSVCLCLCLCFCHCLSSFNCKSCEVLTVE